MKFTSSVRPSSPKSSSSPPSNYPFIFPCPLRLPAGDKTFEGGNDYEIFTHPRVKGHTTTSPADTMSQCKALFAL